MPRPCSTTLRQRPSESSPWERITARQQFSETLNRIGNYMLRRSDQTSAGQAKACGLARGLMTCTPRVRFTAK